MSKKSQKVLASASILSLVMSTVAMAAPTAGSAVSGTSRVDTSVAIAKQAYSKWTDSKVAVIANGADAHLVDALTVAPLAYQKQAPIFLTLGTSTLEDSIVNELKAQGVTTVYVVGGTVTTAVDAQLKAAGVATVTHLAGATRFETAQAINSELEKGGAPSAYAVVNTNSSVADALSIAAEAAKQNIEIVLASDANSVPVDLTGKTVYAVGGTGVLSDALVTKLNATRFAGANRFATNAAVLQGLGSSLDYTTTYVADGTDSHLVDSLPGSVLAAQTGSPIVLVSDTVDPSVASVLTGETSKMTTVTPLGGAVNPNAVAGVVDPTQVTTPTTPVGALAVSSVTAASASSITVTFNQAVSDTTKVAFNVTRSSTPVTLTTSWNDAKTEATLTSATVLPQDTYAVDVKNDTTDLGSTNVSITQQKIAKIAITSTTLAVAQPSGSTPGLGYATYQVFDQYGNDITDSALAASITWTCGIGSVSASKGLLTVTSYSNMYLTQYTTASMNGIDQSTGVTASSNLTVSQSQGTLSSITLDKLENTNNVPLTAEDTTDIWYLDYTAKDLSGNVTTNYDLIKAGLLNGTLTSSNPYVTVQLIRDPNNSTNALIQVTPTADSSIVTDEPLVITAFSTNGTTGSINLTLKKAAMLDTFTLMAPNDSVAYGDTNINIPFTAYDQNGNQLTKYSDIHTHVTLSGGFGAGNMIPHFVDNPDGTCSVQVDAPANTGSTLSQSYTMQATTDTGKYSSLNISVQQAATPDTLTLDNTVALPDMEFGAYQNLDFGANFGGLTLKDQYGRVMNMSTETIGAKGTYYVKATTSGSTSISLTQNVAYDNANIQLKATGTPGTTNINYEVYEIKGNSDGTDKDTGVGVSQQYTLVKPTDITGYTIGTVAPLYDVANTTATTASAVTSSIKTGIGSANISDYENTAAVYGTLSGGAKVVLNTADIKSVNIDNSTDFLADAIQPKGEPAQVAVYAKSTLGTSTKLTATGKVSVTLLGQDNLIHTATGTVNSKDDAPVAQSVAYSVTQTVNGGNVSHVYPNGSSNDVSTNGNNITMSVDSFKTNVLGQCLTKYSPDGKSSSNSWLYFYGVDQYGTDDAPVSALYGTSTNSNYTVNVDSTTNVLTVTDPTSLKAGDVITLNATFNGLIQSVTITLD